MNHREFKTDLVAYFTKSLSAEEIVAFEQHRDSCSLCAAELKTAEQIFLAAEVVASANEALSDDFAAQVMDSLDVEGRSMKAVKRLFSFLLSTTLWVIVFCGLVYLLHKVASQGSGRFAQLLEGNLGIVVMLVSSCLGFILLSGGILRAIKGTGTALRILQPGVAFLTLGLVAVLLRSSTTVFFNYDGNGGPASQVPMTNTSYQDQVFAFRQNIEELTETPGGQALHEHKTRSSGIFESIVDRLEELPGIVASGNPPYLPAQNTEEYRGIVDNGFLTVSQAPLSTFSIDVDTASYSNIRRFLSSNQLPPADAVRIEEMLNYFTYDYPAPTGETPFSITTELSEAPWAANHKLLLVGLQGKRVERENTQGSNLVFLIDTSGSMNSPDKLPLLVNGFKMLTDQLTERDRVAIVAYAGSAGLVLPSTPGSDKATIRQALARLSAGGSTAGGAGLRLAYQVASEQKIENGNNRVVLATDGDFNVGMSSNQELVAYIEQERERGVFLTVLGFGTGNYKDSKMEQLANKGNGNYAYIDSLLEAKKVLVKELSATLFTIAKDVKIQVEFNPAKVQSYRLIGYENRLLAKEDFNDDTKDAGEIGAGHRVTALYEIVPVGAEPVTPLVDALKYQPQQAAPPVASVVSDSNDVLTIKLRYKEPNGFFSKLTEKVVIANEERPRTESSANFRFASAVAEFGMLLRNSPHKGAASFASVLERARSAKGEDVEGYRAEFIRLVEIATLIQR